MTFSTHRYTATLLGSPNRALSVRSGNVRLDVSSAPHVEASLTIAMPVAATLAALDPRMSPPPRVTLAVTATFPWATQNRTFNLTLRDRDIDHRAGTVTLTLSSDEALMLDYRPLADDEGAAASQSSLRGIVNYALNKAIPGAALAAGGANPPVWVNWVTNPRARTNVDGWSASGADAPQRVATGASDDGPYIFVGQFQSGAVRITKTENRAVTGGTPIVVSVELRTERDVPFFLEVRTNGSTWTQSAQLTGRAGQWATYRVELTLPAGATTLDRVQIFCPGNSAVPFAWDVCKLRAIDKPNADRDIDLLVMRAGVDAMSFILPIVQSAGLRLVCDEARVWTLRDEDYSAPGALAIRHGVNLVDGTDRFSRSDEYWFDGVVVIYAWTDASGRSRRVVESYATTATPSRVVTLQRDVPYPGPGFAAYAVRRARGRGRDVSATAVADWTARAEQPIQIVLDGAPTQIGKTSSVRYDLDRDEMTVTTRTTDTPAGAIDLLPGTIDALTGTIDNL